MTSPLRRPILLAALGLVRGAIVALGGAMQAEDSETLDAVWRKVAN